jgi:hypothetical protein|tara:strand:+ start:114 stop:308 length:195 start_codon:yes stop_codon:yes gene_type:complete
MAKKELQLTSVKVITEAFDDFRMTCIKTKFNLQKLVHSSMDMYNTNEEFRKLMHNPTSSGSYSL